MTDYHKKQLEQAIARTKAKAAISSPKPTAPAQPTKNAGLTAAELAHYVGIIEAAAKGHKPEKQVSLLDQIIIQRLEAMGLTPNV